MRIIPQTSVPDFLCLEFNPLETCILATPFGLLKEVEKTEMDGPKMTAWVGTDRTLLYVPFAVLGAIGRAMPCNPHEEMLQNLVGEFVARNLDFSKSFALPGLTG